MATTTYITRTPGSEGNKLKWTFSCWFKRANTSDGTDAEDRIMTGWSSASYESSIVITSSDKLRFMDDNSGVMLLTNRLFRDPGAWYHIVAVWDSANVTSGERMILYVNGVRETSFATETYPAQDKNSWINDDVAQYIGKAGSGGGFLNGVLSHVHLCDGYAYAASDFGEFDSTSGIWKIKTGPSVSYGTNGFFLKMEDRTNLDLDSGTNAFTFTTGGNLTATYDNPSNNFCTGNPLDNYYADGTFTNGNNTIVTGSGKSYNTMNMALSAGLWYFEAKLTASAGTNDFIGIAFDPSNASGNAIGYRQDEYAYLGYNGQIYQNNVNGEAYGDSFTVGDVIGCYLDLTANKLYFGKNGVIQDSGTGWSITAAASTANGHYFMAVADDHSSQASTWEMNFGNGYFGTDLISSPQDDAGGIGAFKYDPSTGTFDSASKDFRAICTKNIKAYGG